MAHRGMNGGKIFAALFHISGSVGEIQFDPGITNRL